MDVSISFPGQKLPYRAKGKKWRKDCVDWAASKTYFNFSPVRKDVVNMKINYDLVNGIIHMDDIAKVMNPGSVSTIFLPDKIQHYPVINSKLFQLRGEEGGRVFDWRVIVTNPSSVSEIEEHKKQALYAAVQGIVENDNIDELQAESQLADNQDFFTYSWQDVKEVQGNELLRHYSKELGFKEIFNDGFMDACIAGIEAYQCGIVGGEPTLVRLNPMKLRVFRSGYSNRIEDADVIIYEDYWSRGKIIDTYYDELSPEAIKWLSEEIPDFGGTGRLGNYDESRAFFPAHTMIGQDAVLIDNTAFPGLFDTLAGYDGGIGSDLLPYDVSGNIRVVQVWWKSLRLIYLVKSFDPQTGEEKIDFYPETYVPDKDSGEEVTKVWVNEMWEGTKIGEDIYVNIRPCLVQHNSISNPSRCHSGVVGTIYNLNESKPYTLVDMMKPYSYMYDAVHAKLVDMIATNWGKLLEMDLALKPDKWDVKQWIYFAKVNRVLIRDSFREGNKGASTGKLAGGLNNATKGVVDADWGDSIQNYINILNWTSESMSNLIGMNRQREGTTYSRETVGGIERAVMQSSYTTDWLFAKHDDTKRRVLDCFIEYAAASIRGRSKKFSYILSDGSRKLMEIDGDEFCQSSYGLVVDSSNDTQKLNSQIETLAQAGLQNQLLDFSSLLKLYTSASIQEKIRVVENAQKKLERKQSEAQQQQMQLEQQKMQAEQEMKMQEMQQQDMLNQRDNNAKIKVAEINSQAEYLRLGIYADENSEELRREEMDIDRQKLRQEIEALDKEIRFKEKELDVKKEIELKKIAAQKNKSKTTK